MLSLDQIVSNIKTVSINIQSTNPTDQTQPTDQSNPTEQTNSTQSKPFGYKSINSSSVIIGSK